MNEYRDQGAPPSGPRQVSDGLLPLRLPPVNIQAEQALLGALLANNRVYERVSDIVREDHFAHAAHAAVFAAIQRRIDAGQVADAITLRSDFEGSAALDAVGGVSYLVQLLTAMVGTINAVEYARTIADCWLRRELIDLGEGMVNKAFASDAEAGPETQIEEAEAVLTALAEGGALAAPLIQAGAAGQKALEAMQAGMLSNGGMIGVETGLAGVNRMTKGFRASQLIIIGARPSMGKTALAGTIACNAAKAGKRVLFVTAEMEAADVMARMLAAESGVPLEVVLSGYSTNSAGIYGPAPQAVFDRVFAADQALKALPIEFEERSAPTVPFLLGRARRMMRQRGLDLIVIDYLGLLRASDMAARQNRNEAVSEITRGLKAMAKELRVPVLALSQLSRDNEKREGKRPQLSDLRDSGSIEQDADVVGFLYREHYYLSKNPPSKKDNESSEQFQMREEEWGDAVERSVGKAELILSKQRQGPTGIIRLRWNGELTWFFDDAEHPAE
jgi:replicative DNA helicase